MKQLLLWLFVFLLLSNTVLFASASRRPRQCPLCPAILATTAIFERHFKIHSGQKPFKCNLCNREFGREDSCKRHQLKCIQKVVALSTPGPVPPLPNPPLPEATLPEPAAQPDQEILEWLRTRGQTPTIHTKDDYTVTAFDLPAGTDYPELNLDS